MTEVVKVQYCIVYCCNVQKLHNW